MLLCRTKKVQALQLSEVVYATREAQAPAHLFRQGMSITSQTRGGHRVPPLPLGVARITKVGIPHHLGQLISTSTMMPFCTKGM
mmetsp:Transcript_162447/g.299780  ORF Transcript_162447/g.299780 Transcript_162447/m.299780 type:complete len:84 (+) Transcript_162447:358-609(+)